MHLCIVHLALALGGGLAAEHGLEVLLADETAEAFGEYQVTHILVMQKNLVLVVQQLLRTCARNTRMRAHAHIRYLMC